MDASRFYSANRRKTTCRFQTLTQAVESIQEHPFGGNVVILPPDAGDRAVDSDIEEPADNQLDEEHLHEPAGEVEVDFIVPESDDESCEPDEQPPVKKRKAAATAKPKWRRSAEFDQKILDTGNDILSLLEQYPLLANSEPVDVWNLFMDHGVLSSIVEQSKLYARRDKNNPEYGLTVGELRRFIGVLILSGYHALPEETHYWSSDPDLGVAAVSECMSLKRFQQIKRFMHLADNTALQQGNKVAKVSPVYDKINENLLQFGVFHKNLSIDESMVPYFGRFGAKMYIKGKPIRYGYKIWCICGSDGYPYHLQIYTGKAEGNSSVPLGSRVINDLIDRVKPHTDLLRHTVFFDNFFSSHGLLMDLSSKQIKAVGTIRDNRTSGADKVLTSTKDMKKKGRGSFDFVCDGTVFVVKWNDNSIVNVASNFLTHIPLQSASRRVKGQSQTLVQQPFVIRQYNESMGGVDLFDRLLASYRPGIRGKKWWWALFIHAINVTVVAAWRVHCQFPDSKSHLTFRRDIARTLLKTPLDVERSSVTKDYRSNPPAAVRYDNADHFPGKVSQGRCRVCSKNTTLSCVRCEVRLHRERGAHCWDMYHMRSLSQPSEG